MCFLKVLVKVFTLEYPTSFEISLIKYMSTEYGRIEKSEGFFSTAYGVKQRSPRLYLKFNEGIKQNKITIKW